MSQYDTLQQVRCRSKKKGGPAEQTAQLAMYEKKASSRGVAFSVFSILDCFFFKRWLLMAMFSKTQLLHPEDAEFSSRHSLKISSPWKRGAVAARRKAAFGHTSCPLLAAGFLGAFHQKINLNNPCGDQHQFSPRKIDRLTGQSLVHLRCQWLLPGYLQTLQPHLRQTSLHLKSPPFWLAKGHLCRWNHWPKMYIYNFPKRLLKAERK